MYIENIISVFTVVCSITLSAPDWHLLSSGTDTRSCGGSASRGCRTLDHLLDRVYGSSSLKPDILSIVTDVNVVINESIVVSTMTYVYRYTPKGALGESEQEKNYC